MEEFDIVVVGSGVGLSIISQALNMGWKCAMIESSKMGGTCLTKGCIPSKVLVYPADVIRTAEHAKKIGLDMSVNKIDWGVISKRMWSQIDEGKGIDAGLSQAPNLTLYRGVGEFTGKHEMRVKLNETGEYTKKFKGKRIVLASGGRSIVPPINGIENVNYLTSETFFGDKFPTKLWKSLIIVGGGVIAAEFAHIFSAFGVDVTIIEMQPHLVSTEEEEISKVLESNFKKLSNLTVRTNTLAKGVKEENGLKILTTENMTTKEQEIFKAEALFLATGRKSNADILQVNKAGIETTERGWIKTNQFTKTNVENIWAIGDANGQFQFRHKANHDVDVCMKNIFTKQKKTLDYSAVPWAIFTYPQIAHVGLTEKQAIEQGHEVLRAVKPYGSVAKGFAMGLDSKDDGFFKLVVDSSYKILGAHAIGPHAAVLIQQFVYLMNAGFTCAPDNDEFQIGIEKLTHACPEAGSFMPLYKSMVIHPSLNEVAGWALGNLEPVNGKKQGHGHH